MILYLCIEGGQDSRIKTQMERFQVMRSENEYIQLRMLDDPISGHAPRSDWHKKGLLEKLSDTYHERHNDPVANAVSSVMSILFFWFILVTELYVFLTHIIPERYAIYGDTTRYYFKVGACFVAAQSAANWLCVRFFKSFVETSEDIPHEFFVQRQTNGHSVHKQSIYSTEDQSGLPWKRCSKCDLDQPFRAHHCIMCRRCVLKRDHHCYMTGVCVGFYNQRFFVVMTFYVALGSLWGMYEIWGYMQDTFVSADLWDYFLPMTVFRWLWTTISFHHMLMMFHMYTLWWAGFTSIAFFIWNIFIISMGKTSNEIKKHVDIRSTANITERFRSVFGPCWWINFFFPAVLVIKQTGNGILWKNLKTT